MAPSKNIAFDVVGTLVSYDHLFEAIESVCGSRLKEVGIQPRLLGCCWLEMAEREYTYLSLSGRYAPFFTTLTGLFYRALWMAGIAEPRRLVAQEDVDRLVDAYKGLEMRPGAAECIAKLRDAGFTVWGFTAGDLERVGGYFARAGIDMPAENLLSCDSTGKSKPEPECYKPVLEKLSSSGTQPCCSARTVNSIIANNHVNVLQVDGHSLAVDSPAWGAPSLLGVTGRNGGHLRPDIYNHPSALAVNHGVEAAAEVAKFKADHLPAGASVSALEDVFCAKRHEVEQLSGVKGAKGCITYTASHLFPYKLAMGLPSKALEAGVSLQMHNPVSEVAEEPDSKGYFTIMTTMRGKARVGRVMYATNSYTTALLPEFEDRIVPGGKPSPPQLSNSYIIRPGTLEYDYFIPSTGGSIVVGVQGQVPQ
ncbi:hypothetical protein DL768_002513 [Monosporascus sp. mg162]|nr:hypothetical protein DL768_002513 [Monosporascus sp. mg162]